MAAMVSIQPSKPASHMPQSSQSELKIVENAAPPLAMFRVEKSGSIGRNKLGPGALVHVQIDAAEAGVEKDVYFLVTHWQLLPSNARSSLRRVNLHAPSGAVLCRGIPSEWVRYVWVDAPRFTTLVQLTRLGLHAMLATGVACRAVAAAAEGMRATHVLGTNALSAMPVRIVRVAGETLKLDRPLCGGEDGLLVGEDGSLVAAVDFMETHYSLAGILSDFLEERMQQIGCHSHALAIPTTIILFSLEKSTFNSNIQAIQH